MTERPILFSAPMVRAILNGSKTQTRRVLKPQIEPWGENGIRWEGRRPKQRFANGSLAATHEDRNFINIFVGSQCPYGKPGDRLWVRENFRLTHSYNDSPPSLAALYGNNIICYEATENHKEFGNLFGKIRPSIHMPRALSRILLEITDIRVERLQDISESDARAEGIRVRNSDLFFSDREGRQKIFALHFQRLWEEINGAESWKKNPWVWVIGFRRVA